MTLVGDSPDAVADARRELVRIGIDRLAGFALGPPEDLADADRLDSYPCATFGDLAAAGDRHRRVLDVRQPSEWTAGHVAGATHIPFYELESRITEVPDAPEVWVYCASGFRASMAASLLARAGHRPVVIDDEWQHAAGSGVEVAAP